MLLPTPYPQNQFHYLYTTLQYLLLNRQMHRQDFHKLYCFPRQHHRGLWLVGKYRHNRYNRSRLLHPEPSLQYRGIFRQMFLWFSYRIS